MCFQVCLPNIYSFKFPYCSVTNEYNPFSSMQTWFLLSADLHFWKVSCLKKIWTEVELTVLLVLYKHTCICQQSNSGKIKSRPTSHPVGTNPKWKHTIILSTAFPWAMWYTSGRCDNSQDWQYWNSTWHCMYPGSTE